MNPKLISMCGECGEFPALRTVAIDCLTGEPLSNPDGGPLVAGDLVSYTEVLVCAAGVSLIRRTAADGTITFVGSDGAAVAVPGPYTIGECPPVALGDDCINPLFVEVCNPTAAVTISTEIYRLDGTVAATTATPSTAPASTPVVGNTVTITAPYKALSWRWMRATLQDAGAGATAALAINGFNYYPGVGTVYSEQGWNIQAAHGETFTGNHTFTATGSAYVEIIVIR